MQNQVAALIIGDEILQAVVKEENLFYTATCLSTIGYDIAEVRIVRDTIQCIADAVSALASSHDYVISSGGVGPTHDDLSMAGIAAGLELSLVEHPEMLAFLSSRYTKKMNMPIRKMAMLPDTAAIYSPNAQWPLIKVQNVFILPGLPPAFRSKMDILVEHLPPCKQKWAKTLYMLPHESEFAEVLQEFQTRFDTLDIGSYPIADGEYHAFVRISGREKESVILCFQELHALFDSRKWLSNKSSAQS